MAAAGTKPSAARKRNRKRKRRAASSSSSSSSSSDSSDDESLPNTKRPVPAKADSEPSESASAESSSESESESDSADEAPVEPSVVTTLPAPIQHKNPPRRLSPSPSPPPPSIPSFIPSNNQGQTDVEKEKLLKEKFRKFWMTAIADGFKDDLEEIRKEPNMNTSRLSLLIDSLASGADVFTSSSRTTTGNDINEMEVVLDPTS